MRFPLSIVLVGLLGPGCVGPSGGGVVPAGGGAGPAGGGVGPAGGRAAPSEGAAVEAPSESDGPTSPAEAANGSHAGEPSLEELGAFLDAWHEAASRADADVYLGSIADDGVFLGTDPSERWDKAAFSAYVLPYFEAGRGWTYLPSNRHAAMEGELAWFDETLENQKYGQLRGTGVARWRGGSWELLQYDLHFTIPNEAGGAVVLLLERLASGESD